MCVYVCMYVYIYIYISQFFHESFGSSWSKAYPKHPIGQRQQSLFHLSRQAPHALAPSGAFGVLMADPERLTQLHQDVRAALAVGLAGGGS